MARMLAGVRHTRQAFDTFGARVLALALQMEDIDAFIGANKRLILAPVRDNGTCVCCDPKGLNEKLLVRRSSFVVTSALRLLLYELPAHSKVGCRVWAGLRCVVVTVAWRRSLPVSALAVTGRGGAVVI